MMLLVLCLPGRRNAAEAQSVHGRVVAGPSASTVSGVIVFLLDSAGKSVDRSLSSETGMYRLHAPAPGHYRLRALRIGFRPTMSAAFPLGAAESLERALPLNDLAVSLASVRVTAGQRCAVQLEAGTLAFDVWEEARKALDATLLTSEQPYTMEVMRYERRVALRGGTIESEWQREARAPSLRPFVSLPAAQLDSAGYVVVGRDGTTYAAPDERILLSEQFAAAHCVKAVNVAAADEIGLQFEPVRGRKVPEVGGTLVLSRATGELRRLTFTYANAPAEVRDGDAGGKLTFRRLPSGAWIVAQWALRMPLFSRVVQQRVSQMSDLARGDVQRLTSVALSGFQESGGEVFEVARGDTVLWSAPRPTLSGIVRDDAGAPVADATISLPALSRSVKTGPDGRFAFPSVRRGRRQVTVAWALTDSLGQSPVLREVDSEHTDSVAIVVPSREGMFSETCAVRSAEESSRMGFVRGVTRGADGERIGGATVVASWFEGSGIRTESRQDLRQRTLQTVSSAAGDYAICGVPPGNVVVLTGTTRETIGTRVSLRIPREGRVAIIDVPVAGLPAEPAP